MSQSEFLHKGYSKTIRKAVSKAAIDVAIVDLVAAINFHHTNGGKRLIKGNQLYNHVIASLRANGIEITHDALKKRVSRALVEERRELVEREKRLTISLTSLSSLSNESLTTSESDDITVTQTYLAGGCPKGSTKAKKKQDVADVSKCIDAIVSEYSKHYNASSHEILHKFEQCDKTECGAYLQYKKQPKDKAISKDLIGRRERCVEWITRPSPTASPNQSEDEDNDAADAAEGLLGMVQTLLREMESKGVLTRMMINMDGEKI